MNKQPTRSTRSVQLRLIKARLMTGFLPALVLMFSLQTARAGSATWNLTPISGHWNTAANWIPATVPDGPNDVASFGGSSITAISMSTTDIEVNEVVFAPGASAFTITADPSDGPLTFSGVGVTNNSGVTQQFVTFRNNTQGFVFNNQATAGSGTIYTAAEGPSHIAFNNQSTADSATFMITGTTTFQDGGSLLLFYDDSNATNANITNSGGAGYDGEGGGTIFFDNASAGSAVIKNTSDTDDFAISPGFSIFHDNSTAANAVITNVGAGGSGEDGGDTDFWESSTAENATITCEAGGVSGANPAQLRFFGNSNAGSATLIAEGGRQQGLIAFNENATGGTARVELFGNGTLDISGLAAVANISIGSLEGDGIVLLGSNRPSLTLGTNDLSTVFSGQIQGSGSVVKDGSGTMTLAGNNTYTGSTSVAGGFLKVSNRSGSATGSGTVKVSEGATLGGSGTVGGNLLAARHGTLAPGTGTTTLTVKRKVTFDGASFYAWRVRTISTQADKLIARGVIIGRGAFLSGIGIGSTALPPGTAFTAIENTSPNPISGTFRNLPDGGTVHIGNNTFQANYEGGDGNDLTLTVAP